MKTLKEIFETKKGYQISKWSTYLDAYENHFEKFRGKEINVLEIGINFGGSLQVWREYFGDKAKIIGVDIHKKCQELALDADIYIGSQTDRDFLRKLKNQIPKLDILIDDGGHTMRQQIITFNEMYDHVKDEGIYVCEDLHTSYWKKYGGGYMRKGTFIEFSKKLIDQLNANHSYQSIFKVDPFTKSAYSMHFYDSLLIIQKKSNPKNVEITSGDSIPFDGFKIKRTRLLEIIQSIIDRIFVFLRLKDPFRR